MPESNEIHDLLPWYLNGTLDPDEEARFAEHLEHCDLCLHESQVLCELRDVMERHGELPHGELPRGEEAFERAPARVTAFRRGLLAGALAATLAAAVAGFLLRGPAIDSGVVASYFVEATSRSEVATLDVPADARAFLLIQYVDLPRSSFPVRVEARSEPGGVAGRAVVLEEAVEPDANGYVFLYCRRSDFPDGEYLVRIRSGDGRVRESRFHVRTVTGETS